MRFLRPDGAGRLHARGVGHLQIHHDALELVLPRNADRRVTVIGFDNLGAVGPGKLEHFPKEAAMQGVVFDNQERAHGSASMGACVGGSSRDRQEQFQPRAFATLTDRCR